MADPTVIPTETPEIDPILEAVEALRAAGIHVEPEGEELERWRVGDLPMSDADVLRLAERRGLIEA